MVNRGLTIVTRLCPYVSGAPSDPICLDPPGSSVRHESTLISQPGPSLSINHGLTAQTEVDESLIRAEVALARDACLIEEGLISGSGIIQQGAPPNHFD
jgi:hypothetical protein